jgi:hypothetical protein
MYSYFSENNFEPTKKIIVPTGYNIERWMGPRVGLDALEERKILRHFREVNHNLSGINIIIIIIIIIIENMIISSICVTNSNEVNMYLFVINVMIFKN